MILVNRNQRANEADIRAWQIKRQRRINRMKCNRPGFGVLIIPALITIGLVAWYGGVL